MALYSCLKTHSQVWGKFLATESPSEMMKIAFYFTSKASFVLKIFTFLSWLFGHVGKTALLERLGQPICDQYSSYG